VTWIRTLLGLRKRYLNKLGMVIFTSFWKDPWLNNQSLCERFPRIYGISNQKTNTIFSMGSWEGEVWRWNFSWRRDPFTWEIPIKDDFLVLIHQFVPSVYEDKWVWRMNVEGGFSVHDYYELLFRSFRETHVVDWCEEVAFERVWKCGAPSKVCAFTWQVLLGRIQTT
jgi:hypothetical protein